MTSSMNMNPGIYIPSVYQNIDWRRIKSVFEDIFGEGTISRVDVVKQKQETTSNSKMNFNRVYVHFKYWPKEFDNIREKLVSGETIKIVYEDPRYWKCMINKYPKSVDSQGNRYEKRAPFIEEMNDTTPKKESVFKKKSVTIQEGENKEEVVMNSETTETEC